MDKSAILGAVGILATIVFGFLSIDLFKRKKYPGKITYIKFNLIDLLNSVANNFSEIEVLHNKIPINKNIIYIKGALVNSGDIDINRKLAEKDISMNLPEGCKWLNIKSTKFSEGLNVNVFIEDEKRASFAFDLFRKNEFVQFEGLIEAESKDISSALIDSELEFFHRIENTSRIDIKNLLSPNQIKKKKKTAIIYSIGLFLMIITISLTLIFNLFGTKKEPIYFREKGSNSAIFYEVSKSNNNEVRLKSKNSESELVLTIEDFNNRFIASKDELTLWQKFKDTYWLIALQLASFLLLVLWELFEIRSAKRLSKIFE